VVCVYHFSPSACVLILNPSGGRRGPIRVRVRVRVSCLCADSEPVRWEESPSTTLSMSIYGNNCLITSILLPSAQVGGEAEYNALYSIFKRAKTHPERLQVPPCALYLPCTSSTVHHERHVSIES